MGIVFFLLISAIPSYVFIYNLVAAISKNIHQKPFTDVVGLNNIFWASLALTSLVFTFLVVLDGF